MKGLDTNVLVRYIMQDDIRQAESATRVIEARTDDDPGYISLVVLVELVWVLVSAYRLDKTQIAEVLTRLLQIREIVVERADDAGRAVTMFMREPADFADCLIAAVARTSGCDVTLTFDRKAAKLAGMTLITPE